MVLLEIKALEQSRAGGSIASPRLVTADQVKASLEHGISTPFQEVCGGVWKIRGVLLVEATPQILADGKILLQMGLQIQVNPNLKEDALGYVQPEQQMQANVVVEENGAVLIGGLCLVNDKNTQRIRQRMGLQAGVQRSVTQVIEFVMQNANYCKEIYVLMAPVVMVPRVMTQE